MRPVRKCALCASKIIERELKAEGQTLYLCPKHSRLTNEVAALAASKRTPKQNVGA